jgi:hypothetical protein
MAVVLSITKLSAAVICTDVGMGMMAIVVPPDGAAPGTGAGAGAVTDAARLHPMSATAVIIAEMRRLVMECERGDSGRHVVVNQ